MASAILFMQWENVVGKPAFFDSDPLTFNSRQPRLHDLAPGDRLWLVSRSPDDLQYYFVAVLEIALLKTNPPASREAELFGPFAVIADKSRSHKLGTRFRAEGLLRALHFDTGKPIKHGASIGQSLQTLRSLSPADKRLLDAVLARLLQGSSTLLEAPFGLWTKCDMAFADYFVVNWNERQMPLAFLLYDSPPELVTGAPVFIHSDKHLRVIARFRESQFVSGQKFTIAAEERTSERERIWSVYRQNTIAAPKKVDFDDFWDRQNGIRSLFLMDELQLLTAPCPFKEYARALEWGYPTGVGYRYLTLSQSYLLLRQANFSEEDCVNYVSPFVDS